MALHESKAGDWMYASFWLILVGGLAIIGMIGMNSIGSKLDELIKCLGYRK